MLPPAFNQAGAGSVNRLFHFLRRRASFALISPEELKRRLESADPIAVIDLRHPLDLLSDPRSIPGALRISPREIEARHQEIPRDRDVVLYCTCPNQATSAQTAALLAAKGITRVRLLAGGFHAWRARGYPLIESLLSAQARSQASTGN